MSLPGGADQPSPGSVDQTMAEFTHQYEYEAEGNEVYLDPSVLTKRPGEMLSSDFTDDPIFFIDPVAESLDNEQPFDLSWGQAFNSMPTGESFQAQSTVQQDLLPQTPWSYGGQYQDPYVPQVPERVNAYAIDNPAYAPANSATTFNARLPTIAEDATQQVGVEEVEKLEETEQVGVEDDEQVDEDFDPKAAVVTEADHWIKSVISPADWALMLSSTTNDLKPIKDTFGHNVFPPSDTPLPDGVTLSEICCWYPNHIQGPFIQRFKDENWSARLITRAISDQGNVERMKKSSHEVIKQPWGIFQQRLRNFDFLKHLHIRLTEQAAKAGKKYTGTKLEERILLLTEAAPKTSELGKRKRDSDETEQITDLDRGTPTRSIKKLRRTREEVQDGKILQQLERVVKNAKNGDEKTSAPSRKRQPGIPWLVKPGVDVDAWMVKDAAAKLERETKKAEAAGMTHAEWQAAEETRKAEEKQLKKEAAKTSPKKKATRARATKKAAQTSTSKKSSPTTRATRSSRAAVKSTDVSQITIGDYTAVTSQTANNDEIPPPNARDNGSHLKASQSPTVVVDAIPESNIDPRLFGPQSTQVTPQQDTVPPTTQLPSGLFDNGEDGIWKKVESELRPQIHRWVEACMRGNEEVHLIGTQAHVDRVNQQLLMVMSDWHWNFMFQNSISDSDQINPTCGNDDQISLVYNTLQCIFEMSLGLQCRQMYRHLLPQHIQASLEEDVRDRMTRRIDYLIKEHAGVAEKLAQQQSEPSSPTNYY